MFFCYYDESGDDGYPQYSSPFFVLTAIYFNENVWKETFNRIHEFRTGLKEKYGLPVKMEFHTKQFLLDKDPYRPFGFTSDTKKQIMDEWCTFIGWLEAIKIINVVINKRKITKPDYDVLETALTYSIQRIENDLDLKHNPDSRFLIITDEGRVGKMRTIARKIQRINYIPSKFGMESRRQEISALIEDPLPKDSKESYFIQLADLISYLIALYAGLKLEGKEALPNRLKYCHVTPMDVKRWMDSVTPSLNLKAAPRNKYGVKIHPE